MLAEKRTTRGISGWGEGAVCDLDPSLRCVPYLDFAFSFILNVDRNHFLLELKFALIFKYNFCRTNYNQDNQLAKYESSTVVGYKARKFNRFLSFPALAGTSLGNLLKTEKFHL